MGAESSWSHVRRRTFCTCHIIVDRLFLWTMLLSVQEHLSFPAALLQSPDVPERLTSNNTWNCSVPLWPHFKRHFRCNLRQECFNGEDEVQCPYSSCRHGGVSFHGHCYFIFEPDTRLTWFEARQECRKTRAYLASLTSAGEWSDVMTWLHLRSTRLKAGLGIKRIYIGLATTTPNLPYM